MTDPSPQQQPGYPTAEQQAYAQQQQAAYAAQQQAAQPQQGYQQPVPSQFTSKLPMNMMTLGLVGGGLAALLLAQIIAGADLVGSSVLSLPAATILLAGLCVTTGDKFRNFYRAATAGLTAATAGSVIGTLIESSTQEAKHIIGALLLLAGLGLLTAATFTMSAPAELPTAPGQQHAGQPTGMVQQPQATQQYPGQQPQQGGWQQ